MLVLGLEFVSKREGFQTKNSVVTGLCLHQESKDRNSGLDAGGKGILPPHAVCNSWLLKCPWLLNASISQEDSSWF